MYLYVVRYIGVGAPEAGGKSFSSTAFAAGDTVSVQLEVDILRLLQEDHGGWNDTMASVSIAGEDRERGHPIQGFIQGFCWGGL